MTRLRKILFIVKPIFAGSSGSPNRGRRIFESGKMWMPWRLSGNGLSMRNGLPVGRLSEVHARQMTDTHRFFRYAFTFIDACRVDVRASGDLTRGEREELERMATCRLAGRRRMRLLRFAADNSIVLRYLAALLRSREAGRDHSYLRIITVVDQENLASPWASTSTRP